jgi:hypothetical protein
LGYGRPTSSLEAFLDSMGFGTSTIVSASYLRLCATRICLGRALHTYPRTTIAGDAIPSCVTPSLAYCRSSGPPRGSLAAGFGCWRKQAGTGISTCCPSTTPLGLALGPDLPWADEPSPGTLGQSAEGFLPPLSLLMPAFALDTRPRSGSPRRFTRVSTLPYPTCPLSRWWHAAAASVHGLAPLHCRRRTS